MTDSRALISDKDGRLLNRIMLDIAKDVRIDRRFNGRINNLQLLGDRKRPDETVCRMSEPEWKDHPQIQILLERRDRYLSCKNALTQAQTILASVTFNEPDDFLVALRDVAKLEAQSDANLKAMETCFVAIRHNGAQRTKSLTDIVTKAASIAETARMHHERLEVEKQKIGAKDIDDLIGEVVRDDEATR